MKKYQELENLIKSKTAPQYFDVNKKSLESMLTQKDTPLVIDDKLLIDALALEGEYRILELSYNNLEYEINTKVLKYILKEALFIVSSFEDDGNHYEHIKNFSEYLYANTVKEQSFRIGVKRVKKLSDFPVKILFSGILPINQLRMYIGRELDLVIHSDEDYFQTLFAQARDKISNTTGVPLLPLYPEVDTTLTSFAVKLIEPVTQKTIVEFEVESSSDRDGIEVYLLKLFYVYQQLIEDKK